MVREKGVNIYFTTALVNVDVLKKCCIQMLQGNGFQARWQSICGIPASFAVHV